MQTQPHRVVGNVRKCLACLIIRPNPARNHRLSLLDGLPEDEQVILLREGRRADFAMMAPDATFCADDVFAKQVDGTIHFNRLWEVIPACGDLINSFSICNPHHNAARRDGEESTTTGLAKRLELLVPCKLGCKVAMFVVRLELMNVSEQGLT